MSLIKLNQNICRILNIHSLKFHNSAVLCAKVDNEVSQAKNEDEQQPIEVDPEEERIFETALQNKRNISRLLPQHRNMLNNQVPYENAQSWIHQTAKYKRTMFGRYGLESKTPPEICFWSKAEQKEHKEFVEALQPMTFQQLDKLTKQHRLEKKTQVVKREQTIAAKLEKLEQWKTELNRKIEKKESDARAAKDRKERLIEEVKVHFGYKVDPRDEKFKDMLEQKEREDKKKMKEEKRKQKESKMLEKLISKDKATTETKEAKAD